VKRAIIILLVIGMMAVVAGCARWPGEPGPGPGEENYQLEITVEVAGVINADDVIYYIVLDADGKLETWPGEDIGDWEKDFYYVKLKGGFFHFAQVEEESPELQLTSSSYSENKLKVTVALSDLGNPESSININVVTTDLDGYTYDSLNDYFSIRTELNQTGEGGLSDDLEAGEADFDITKVTAVITTLY